MKKFFSLLTRTFFLVAVSFAAVAVGIWRRLNLQSPYLKLFAGGLLVALLIAAAILVFRREKGNAAVNAVGGFLLVLPSVLVLRWVFGIAIFRFSFVIYLMAILCAGIYAVALAVVARKARLEAQKLNGLLGPKPSDPQK